MLLPTLLFAAALQVSDQSANPMPVPGDVNTCVLCHGTPEFWSADQQRFYVPPDRLANDVHFQRGVKCYQCHGGNPTSLDPAIAHARQQTVGADQPFGSLTKTCGSCHESQQQGLLQGVHREIAGGADPRMSCRSCHSDQAHQILPVTDPASPVHLRNQVEQCARCHEQPTDEYRRSPHGHGVFQSGLAAAVCADCHGAHAIYRASNIASKLHVTRVADTCAQCHRLIEERLRRSVHGHGSGPGQEADRPAPGGVTRRRPSCTDCHVGHDLPDPRSAVVRNEQGDRCGHCHTAMETSYQLSMHGELSDLGYTAAQMFRLPWIARDPGRVQSRLIHVPPQSP